MFENADKKYLSVTKIFEKLISNNDFAVPNSIILHGPDVISQYYFAMLLARGANCLGDKSENCDCQNCRWIKKNEHPEIITVSKINSKPEGDDSKSVISVKPINMIKDKLVISSDYHRFFIFCDAEIKDFNDIEKNDFEQIYNYNQEMPKYENGYWVPLGLTEACFSDIVANALLKAVEEPPQNVTFVFLTENSENIISTIVSRSQIFYVAGNSQKKYDYIFLLKILENYPNIDRNKAVIISDFLLNYAKEQNISMPQILYSVQEMLKNILKENSDNLTLKSKIFNDIEKIQKIIKMSELGFKNQVVADEAGYLLTK